MRAFYTRRFLEHYAKAPLTIQRAVDRRIALLVQNLRHPSLRAKKYDEVHDIWQARVNGGQPLDFSEVGRQKSGAFIVPSSNLFPKQMMCHARSAWWLETKSYARIAW